MKLLPRWLTPQTRSHRYARPSQPPAEFTVHKLEFLGEQDGQPEQELKGKLYRVCERWSDVSRAYLARVNYEATPDPSVALALSGKTDHAKDIVREVGRVFAALFNSREHLDTLFLTEEQEVRLARVCRPFFVRHRIGDAD